MDNANKTPFSPSQPLSKPLHMRNLVTKVVSVQILTIFFLGPLPLVFLLYLTSASLIRWLSSWAVFLDYLVCLPSELTASKAPFKDLSHDLRPMNPQKLHTWSLRADTALRNE